MSDPLTPLLDVLADLDEDTLGTCYGIRRADDAPLDAALFAWRDAGCPRPESARLTARRDAARALLQASLPTMDVCDAKLDKAIAERDGMARQRDEARAELERVRDERDAARADAARVRSAAASVLVEIVETKAVIATVLNAAPPVVRIALGRAIERAHRGRSPEQIAAYLADRLRVIDPATPAEIDEEEEP